MTRRPRIPGTRNPKTLYILPAIHDELDEATKNGLAIRNACSVEGRCPGCGVVGEFEVDPRFEGVLHLVFRHEPECAALTDAA